MSSSTPNPNRTPGNSGAAFLAVIDQVDAAAQHAARILAQAAERHGAGAALEPGHPSAWLNAQMDAVLRGIRTRTARACPHVASAPQILHAFAWRPGYLCCSRCVSVLRPAPEEETLCDRCGTHDEGIHSCLAAHGPILFGYGLCGPCDRLVNTGQR